MFKDDVINSLAKDDRSDLHSISQLECQVSCAHSHDFLWVGIDIDEDVVGEELGDHLSYDWDQRGASYQYETIDLIFRKFSFS